MSDERPAIVEHDHLEYLDDLRESGVVNMLGAVPYLQEAFSLSSEEAKTILVYWMENYSGH